MSRLMAVAVAALLGACGGGAAPSPYVCRARPPAPLENIDETYLRINEVVPGFAGIYLDPAPTLCIALVDPARAVAARAEVTCALGDDTSKAEIRKVKYEFAQLKAWQRLMESAPCGLLPGLTGWDADERHNVALVTVSDASYAADVRACGVAAGIPPDGLDVTVMGPVTF